MQSTHKPLPVIEIRNPCPKSWEQMKGTDGKRFCEHCQQYVHDLSALRDDEVASLLCKSAGTFCVRYQPLADGSIKTLDYQERDAHHGRTRRWMLVGVIVAMIGGVANAMWHKKQPPPLPMVLGDMAPITTAPTNTPVMGKPAPPTTSSSTSPNTGA